MQTCNRRRELRDELPVRRASFMMGKELAIQEKMRCEVQAARRAHDGDLPYEELMKLSWVDAIVKETLRVCVSLHIAQFHGIERATGTHRRRR